MTYIPTDLSILSVIILIMTVIIFLLFVVFMTISHYRYKDTVRMLDEINNRISYLDCDEEDPDEGEELPEPVKKKENVIPIKSKE